MLPGLSLGFSDRWACQPVIGVKRQMFRMDDEHADLADAAFDKVRESVLHRDNYSCRFCAFKSAKYQEVHHFDNNHRGVHPPVRHLRHSKLDRHPHGSKNFPRAR